ncbi:Predicted oxidoreductase [Pseudarcicella hirudinis]|uniref:Predicted oxidoreductase n=1 Tax=Pseudarcicella hirudinis TaxID=1079859 RepID=A0A1I5MDT7_9BACT|nr:aldo/keto reductase [Pseudarcicella hirudinis]SFP07778.1 Predicted oxidoreductase [Pseudarcicella hirudinis]
MEKKKLGNTDLQVAPLTFGGNVFGWTIDEKTSFELLDAFVSGGFNLIDTADVYSRWGSGNSGGESETIIGNWLKLRGNRDKAIIATKVGSDMGQGKRDISKAYILKAVEDSLKRLRTDYIDLYQTHWDVESTPVEETLEAYSQLVKEGKVRWIGASNLSAERLKASLEASKRYNFPVYQTFQPEYNLYAREGLEKELLGICLENNIGIINYYSLASGFLTGKYRSAADFGKSARGGGMNAYLNERGLNILKALDTVSERHQTSPASVAIAWLIAKPGITAPIASATNLNQLDALIEATKLKLRNEDIILLDYASAWH